MKILILGAAGRTGRELAALASTKHQVTAFVKSAESVDFGQSVRTIVGDAMNYSDIKKATANQDVVISVLGHSKSTPALMQTSAMSNCVSAIAEHKQRTKLISLTGTGVRSHGDQPSLIDRLLNWSVELIDPKRVQDGKQHVEIIKNSKQPWVVLRVLKLTNSRGCYFHLTNGGPAKTFAPRASIASCLLNLANSSQWDKQLPVFSRPPHW